MKSKRRTNKISKNRRLAIIFSTGFVIIVCTVLLSSKLTENNQQLIEPEVTSNYQLKDSINPKEVPLNQEVKPVKDISTSDPAPATQWPIIYSLEQAGSLTVVVNKKHKLPANYVPTLVRVAGGNMRSEAANALEQLLSSASSAGVPMSVISSYRSYNTQISTYNRWVQQSGQVVADTFSARPGHSEHQTGLAVDLGNGTCDLEICFSNTSASQWLASNAHNYGYIIRYPDDKQVETGYQYEPWHLRFIGVAEAKAVVNSGQTLDQYYGVEAGDY